MSSVLDEIGEGFDEINALVGALGSLAADHAAVMSSQMGKVAVSTDELPRAAAASAAQCAGLAGAATALGAEVTQATAGIADTATRTRGLVADTGQALGGAHDGVLQGAGEAQRAATDLRDVLSTERDSLQQSTAAAVGRSAAVREAAVATAQSAEAFVTETGRAAGQQAAALTASQAATGARVGDLAQRLQTHSAETLPGGFGGVQSASSEGAPVAKAGFDTAAAKTEVSLRELGDEGKKNGRRYQDGAQDDFGRHDRAARTELPGRVEGEVSSTTLPSVQQSTNELTRTSMNVQNAAYAMQDVEKHLPAVGELHDHVSAALGRSRSSALQNQGEVPALKMDMAIDHMKDDMRIFHMDMAIDHMKDDMRIFHMDMKIDKMQDEMLVNHRDMKIDKMQDEMLANHPDLKIDKMKDDMLVNHPDMKIDKMKDDMLVNHPDLKIDKMQEQMIINRKAGTPPPGAPEKK